ncbi:hypothetical protein [Neisseria montereyensis]|uniref:Uncharacterized protein n=1 Tax=Neisseria montereyensis TaxID=2973938 RepID=A0ABT2FAE8_9NEIS|nr:hypothetical protein [Neisseria montereyensis]MCS4533137.1 hypothetical protein [Neisseria montereyensis]
MRNFISIIFCLVVVLCFYMLGLTSFISTQTTVDKWSAAVFFAAVGLVCLFIGLALRRFKNWRLNTALTLLAACLIVCGVLFTIMAAPGILVIAGNGSVMSLKDFGDYKTGGSILTAFLIISGLLTIRHYKVTELNDKITALKQRIQRL